MTLNQIAGTYFCLVTTTGQVVFTSPDIDACRARRDTMKTPSWDIHQVRTFVSMADRGAEPEVKAQLRIVS